MFLGPDERLILSHRAESRAIFARGALAAARFLVGKPAGLYSMRDVIDALIADVNKAQVFEFFRRLAEANPAPTTELEYSQPLHAAGRGGAVGAGDRRQRQPRDARPVQARPNARSRWSRSARRRCATQIKTIGLFNTKAKNVIALSEALIRDYGGEVPRTREELETLPGVGRKTANVVLNTAFGQETFAVDTHIFRVGNRTGLAPGKTPLEVELKLDKIMPQPFRRDAHHWLILHGRYTCKARLPVCWRCPVIDLCRYKPKTPPPKGSAPAPLEPVA